MPPQRGPGGRVRPADPALVTARLRRAHAAVLRPQKAMLKAKPELLGAVLEARAAGWSYVQIAKVLGVTKSRAQTLSNEARGLLEGTP